MSEWSERDYWEHVASLAREVEEQARGGCDRHDATWEAVDGSAWVIYTAGNLGVLRATRNDDAAWENGEGVDGCSSSSEVYTRMAFYALLADVEAEVSDEACEEPEEPEDGEEDEESQTDGVDTDAGSES